MKMPLSLLLLPVLVFAFMGIMTPANANLNHLGVVAVVGDSPISTLDLADRTQLIIRSSGLSDSAEVRKKVTSQSLKQLSWRTTRRSKSISRAAVTLVLPSVALSCFSR